MTLLSLLACQQQQVTLKPILKMIPYSALPGWSTDPLEEVYEALKESCKVLCISPFEAQPFENVEIKSWQPFCNAIMELETPTHLKIKSLFERYLVPYQIWVAEKSEGFCTGYYEPQLRGSRTKTEVYNVPIYTCPSDLVIIENLGIFREELKGIRIAGYNKDGHLKPYYTRAEIENGALANKGVNGKRKFPHFGN